MASPDELPDEVKESIVGQLACWKTPSDVAAAVKADFGLDVTRQRVEGYDPTKVAGKALSEHYRALFKEARDRYLADTAEIGIAQQTFRLRMYERMALKAEAAGNMGMAAQLAEQAAKDMGGYFTNRRELSGPGGKPIEHREAPPQTPQQVTDELAGIFGAAAVEQPVPPRAAQDQARNDPVVHDDPDACFGPVTGAFAQGPKEAGAQ
jgi:hypothetical protein